MLNNVNFLNNIIILKTMNYILYMMISIGDWGLGIGDWAQSPIPNPQSPLEFNYL